MSSDPSTAASYFADPEKYVRKNPYIQVRSHLIQGMLPRLHDASIVDVGAGSGGVTMPLLEAGNRILFVDASQGMVDLAMRSVPHRHRQRVRAVCAGVMDFATDERFDVVVCVGVLAHVPTWQAALEKLASWVAPHGVLVLQLTDHGAKLGRLTHALGRVTSRLLDRATHAHQRMTLADVEKVLATVAFTLKESRRYCFVPGLRALPEELATAIARAGVESPFAHRHGGEVVATFHRRPAASS
jgi:2-polyprenyl-3-methyl-5-hydroxy-6-metoxy-1,4-benzoquinol methylase